MRERSWGGTAWEKTNSKAQKTGGSQMEVCTIKSIETEGGQGTKKGEKKTRG